MWSFKNTARVTAALGFAIGSPRLTATGADSIASAEPEQSPTAFVSAGRDGFAISSADREYELRFHFNVQADARSFLGDSIGDDTFLLRRVRPSLEGNAGRNISFRVMPDLAPDQSSLIDAWGNVRVTPEIQIRFGQFKAPFDLERLVMQTDLLFVERGHPSSLGPNRDIGVQLHGKLGGGMVDYAAGVFNGAADGAIATTGSGGHKEIAARVFAHPFHRDAGSFLHYFGIGAAVTFGDKENESPSGYKTLAQQRFFSFRTGVRNDGTHQRISPQVYFYKGPFGLMTSWTLSSQELIYESTAGRIDNTGWMVAGSWVLTGEDASYRSVAPRAPFNPSEGSWGALEVAARLSGLRIDENAFPVFADPRVSARDTLAATVGLNWYLSQNLRFVANFEHATFEDGSPSGDRPDENALLTRLQFNF